MKTADEFRRRLIELGACDDALSWAAGKTAAEAWEQCERGDWLLWWGQKEGTDLRQMTLAKGRCAKLVLHLMQDDRSIAAVEAAENYGLGLIDLAELTAAAVAAAAASAASSASYAAWSAAVTHASAAYAAYAASAAYAAYAAAAAYADAASVAAKSETLKRCAVIVRAHIKPNFI